MTRILLIPVAGTIAALIAITLARQPRGEAEPENTFAQDAPEHLAQPEDETEPPPEDETEPTPPPAPEPQELQLRLEADGTLVEALTGLVDREPISFASIDDLVKKIGNVRHTLVLTNGKGVTEKTLDDALVRLRDRFKVLKVYSAPETPPAEGH